MTVRLSLKPEVEAEIAQKAAAEGTGVSGYLEKTIEGIVVPNPATDRPQTQLAKNQAALAMLEEWDREDETDDPKEIARRQAEWAEFKKGMNESRTSNRVLFP